MTKDDARMENVRGEWQISTLAGGCFWCLEAVFLELEGVLQVTSGYSGGTVRNPSYQQICTGTTGHAEAVQITFDPNVISFRQLLQVFFSIHDPTTLNRQGADIGPQYRSAIFAHTPAQKEIADDLIDELNAAQIWKNEIVTEVTPYSEFYEAEEYHQRYYERNAHQPYCQIVISPKLAKFRKEFATRTKASAS
jgi:peptide-methionine (S)-S-oxide reductase